MSIMGATQKITIEVPKDLLAKARKFTGKGITQTVRSGLQVLAASEAYENLLKLEGKVRFSRTWQELKYDR
jgi:hypothetical protein